MNRETVSLTVEHIRRLKRAATFQSRQLVGVIADLLSDLLNNHATPRCIDLHDGTILWVDPMDGEVKFAKLIDLDRDMLADLRSRDEAARSENDASEWAAIRDELLRLAKQPSHHVHQVASYIEFNTIAWIDLKGQTVWWLDVEQLEGESSEEVHHVAD